MWLIQNKTKNKEKHENEEIWLLKTILKKGTTSEKYWKIVKNKAIWLKTILK